MISVGVWFLIPELVAQGQVLVDTMPDYLDRAQVFLKRYPALNDRVQGIFEPPAGGGEVTDVPVSRVLEAGSAVVQGLLNVFLVLVMAVYNQIARFLSPVQQIKFRKAMPEFVTVVSGYVVGQFITSLMFGVFAFVTLTAFGVPQALLLAMFAAFMDAIPLVGAPLATIPAVLAALTVSVPTAVGVLALYLVYQQLENYLIVPRIYGRTLQVSPLSVLIGVLVGGELLGIVGILLALPLTAAIPIAVRLWREEVEAPSSAIDPAAPAVEVPLTSHE
jgi:predicted PurR-regulated permease PerM